MGQNQNNNQNQRQARTHKKALPIGKAEDVKYKSEFADANDVEAAERAEAADERQE
jgi:hypothetical protein